MHALSSIGSLISHEPFLEGSQGYRGLQTAYLPHTSGRLSATSRWLLSSPAAHALLFQVIEQSQRATASPCARASGAPWGVAAAGLGALRPAKHRLHVARIERHPPPVDPARAQGRARPAAGPLIQSRPAKGSRRRGLPGTVVGSVLGTPARLMLPAGVHLVHLALHTFLGKGSHCWPAAQHHSYEDTSVQLLGKESADIFTAHMTEAERQLH